MFDFAHHMHRLIEDIVQKVPLFSYIEPHRILVSCADARAYGEYGTWAQIYPMKYENGHYSIRERQGSKIYLFKTDRLKMGRTEILYIIYFLMPRFQNLSYFQKLETIFHELYHISSEFDGKLRVMHPRFIFHGLSIKEYDRNIRYWVRQYLNSKPSFFRNKFLEYSFRELESKFGKVDLAYIPEPKETLRVMMSHRKKRPSPARKKLKTV